MGVMGLEFYIQKIVPNGWKDINMIDEIMKWKKNNANESPIIIIDLCWLIYCINENKFDETVCGGRNGIVLKEIEDFLDKLRTSGAKLVFFERAYVNTDAHIYDWNMYKNNSSKIVTNKRMLSSLENKSLLGLDIDSIGKKFGEMKYCYYQRYTEALSFIKENGNVLAIIAKDSNFLMYELGNTQYWARNEFLNMKTFNTKSFNVEELNAFLQFSQKQKALFATIARLHFEKFVNNFDLPLFASQNYENCAYYERLDKREKSQWGVEYKSCFLRIKMVAAYVFTKFPDSVLVNEPDFSKLAKDVFDVEGDAELERKLKKLYDEYKEFSVVNYEEEDEDKHKLYYSSAKKYQFIYSILIRNQLSLPAHDFAMVDMNCWNESGKNYVELILPIYKRTMGILHQHKGDETISCSIVASPFHMKLFPNAKELAEYPKVEVPDLDTLIFNTNDGDEGLNDIKWHLLFWILAIKFDDSKYQDFVKVRNDLKPVLLTLVFLRQEQQISVNEADTIFITEMDYIKERISSNISAPKNPDCKAVRIAHLYVQLRNILNHCFRACGLLKYAESSKFDGVHFHHLLDKYQNQVLYNLALNRIKEYRLYA